MNPNELKQRSKSFALRIIKLSESLPKTVSGRALAAQIVRSGTSVAANYRSACRARSKAEFLARMGVVEEEADETALWLELIGESKLMPQVRLADLLEEANELTAIMASFRKTAAARH